MLEILELAAFTIRENFQLFSWKFLGVFLGNPEQTPETATAFSSFLKDVWGLGLPRFSTEPGLCESYALLGAKSYPFVHHM